LNLLFLALLLCSGLQAQSLLWEIRGNGLKSPSYLFGTDHMICRDEVPAMDSAYLALSRCRKLYLEMDEKKVGMVKKMKHVFMKGDTSLKDLLSPSELEEVENLFRDSVGVDIKAMYRFKPMLLLAFGII